MRDVAVRLRDGRTLVAHDTGPDSGVGLTVVWHHGSPQTGRLLDSLIAAAKPLGIRLVSYGRPGYGGSSPNPGRIAASAGADVAAVADALGIERFAVVGASGGGPHALACAALYPERVTAAATLAGIAPFTDEFDWFAGMRAPGGLRAAMGGRAERLRFAEVDEFDEAIFTERDWASLGGAWAGLGRDAAEAGRAGPEGLVDDDLAFVRPWGFDLGAVAVPTLVIQGGEDRVVPVAHGMWTADRIPNGAFSLRPNEGHISVLDAVPDALAWLLQPA